MTPSGFPVTRAEIAFMRSFIVGRGAEVRRGENGGGVKTRAAAAGGIACGCGGIAGAGGAVGGAITFGGACGRIRFDSGTGGCAVGASGFGSIGFGTVGGEGGMTGGVAITGGAGTDGGGARGFGSGATSGFFSVTEIGGAVSVLSGGCGMNCGGTASGEGICTCG